MAPVSNTPQCLADMYIPANPYSYYPDIDMVLFSLKPFGQVHYFLAPRVMLRHEKFATDKIIKWQIGSSRGEYPVQDISALDQQIRNAITQPDESVADSKIAELLKLNKTKDKQQYKLYRAEDAAFPFQRMNMDETCILANSIADEYSMPCPEVLWDSGKMRAKPDFNFLAQAHSKGILMTPRLIRNGIVAISPLMCGVAADFFYAARNWKAEPRIQRAYYRPTDKSITFEADHAAKHFVIHEMAHAYAHHVYPHDLSPHHGPHFVGIYRDMIVRNMTSQDEKNMREKFDLNIHRDDLSGERFLAQFPDMHISRCGHTSGQTDHLRALSL